MFDDFDIDYNQYKYLIETRCAGALIRPKSAMVVRTTLSTAVKVTATTPTFNEATGVVTIPTVTGVVYKNGETGATLTPGAQAALAAGDSLSVDADASGTGYYLETSEGTTWTFTRPAA